MTSFMKSFAFVSCLAFIAAAFSPTARADVWNKKSILTISEPIQVSKIVLDPGTYVIKLADSSSDRHVVQIFNQDETHLITTVIAIPNYRLQPTGKTRFNFWETPAGQPAAVRAWFYPGDSFGQEFVYPRSITSLITVPERAPEPAAVSEPAPSPDIEPQPAEQPATTPAPTSAPPLPEPPQR
jgi:hypothetical protein